MKTPNVVFVIIATIVGFLTPFAVADTGFTYQGQLNQNGSPVTEICDFQFRLYDAASGSNQIGSTFLASDVVVTNGVFSVDIDFGADAFDNSPRWLYIAVRCPASVGAFHELNPRTAITRSPYAIQTRGIFVNDDQSFIGIGRNNPITSAEVFGISKDTSGFGGMYVETTDPEGWPFYGYSAGGNVDAYHYYDGFTGRWHFVNSSGIPLSISGFGNVGMGDVISPIYTLHVERDSGTVIYGRSTGNAQGVFGETTSTSSAGVAGLASSTTGSNKGVSGQSNSATGRGVFGIAAAQSGTNYGVYGESNSAVGGRGVFGYVNDSGGVNFGVEGKSNSVNGYDFYASGAGMNYGVGSSRRWKNNIETINDPLDKLSSIRGVYFRWDEEHGGHHDIGFIAEEVGEVLPEIVNYEENGLDAHGMDYSKLTPLLVEAIKALLAENEAMRKRLDAIERILGSDSKYP